MTVSSGRASAAVVAALLMAAPRGAIGQEAPVRLVIRGDGLPEAALAAAVANELGRPVTTAAVPDDAASGVLTVTFRRAAHELAVTWDAKNATVSRVVSARDRTSDVVADAALLAGNLARSEADDLAPPPRAGAAADAGPLDPLPERPGRADARPDPVAEREAPSANLSLFYPFATNFGKPWVKTPFEVNVLHGRVGELEGFQLGLVNVVAKVEGRATGNVVGVQLSPFGANVATGAVTGVQHAMVVNVAAGGLDGLQTAFGMNFAGAPVRGVQGAFGLNVARSEVSGLQLSLLNVGGDVTGGQVGILNIARKVEGAMVGLVNVADDVDGVPLGLVSVTRSGGVHPLAWSSNTSLASAGVKFATRHTYTIASGHYHRAYSHDFVGAGFAVGGHVPVGGTRLSVDFDLGLVWLVAPERSGAVGETPRGTYHEHLVSPKLRVLGGYSLAERLRFFAGGGLVAQVRLEDDGEKATIRLGPELTLGLEF